MKKFYLKPEVEFEDMLTEEFIAVSGVEGGNDDGGSGIIEGDPTDPNWGSDFGRLLDF